MAYILANAACIVYIISSAVLTQVCQWLLVSQLHTDQTYFLPVTDHPGTSSTQNLTDQITDWLT